MIEPEVGSTSRLMQRISVDLPVPDGPMIATMPGSETLSEMSRRTGWPLGGPPLRREGRSWA
jgi:hypothetical protein